LRLGTAPLVLMLILVLTMAISAILLGHIGLCSL
jgi:hypothetical protein